MNSDQLGSILRTVLKLVSGAAIAKGIGNDTAWEAVIGGVVGAVGIWLSYRSAKEKTVLKDAVSGDVALNHPSVTDIVPSPEPVAKANEPPMVSPVSGKQP